MRKSLVVIGLLAAFAAPPMAVEAANLFRLEEGKADIKHAGVLAFGPQGVLFVGDTKSAAVFAIGTGESTGDPANAKVHVHDLGQALANSYGAAPGQVTVNDLAVNPLSGSVYLSVTHGANDAPGIVKIDSGGAVTPMDLDRVWFSKAELSDAPEDKATGEGRRRRNRRNDSITDLAFVEGQLIVSGLTNRESASGVRSLSFPFQRDAKSSSLEIYHGAHGRSEDTSAIRTFVPFMIDGKPNLLAGFVCTPLVRFPLDAIRDDGRVQGTTVAELGNRNRPLDMFTYEKDGKSFLLLSNSARGVMKVGTDQIEDHPGITERVERGGTAGQTYETISALQNVVQMDRLNDTQAVVLTQADGGSMHLAAVPLP